MEEIENLKSESVWAFNSAHIYLVLFTCKVPFYKGEEMLLVVALKNTFMDRKRSNLSWDKDYLWLGAHDQTFKCWLWRRNRPLGRDWWAEHIPGEDIQKPLGQEVQVREENNFTKYGWAGNVVHISIMKLHNEIFTNSFSEIKKIRQWSVCFKRAKLIWFKLLSFILRLCSFLFGVLKFSLTK